MSVVEKLCKDSEMTSIIMEKGLKSFGKKDANIELKIYYYFWTMLDYQPKINFKTT